MNANKARTMPGVMELLPLEQIAFQNLLDILRRNFERFGFLPIETPAIEFSNLLLTKSGGETERQVYFVQSTGRLKQGQEPELALRFDLTIPLARYVAEHEADLTFPFRRYQMQRVYRGESAQRGRFREFYQCDIDVIGKDTLSVRFDAELPAVIYSIFNELKIGPFTIQINNRKLLRGFLERLGIVDSERQIMILREIDKLDKRGERHVRETLTGAAFGLSAEVVATMLALVGTRSNGHQDALDKLNTIGNGNDTLETGIAELREVLELVHAFGVPESHYALNFSIARGLDYYTGTVYETTLDQHPEIGSICSGGRYENLANHYTRSQLPGVGISIGATRLFWQLQQKNIIGKGQSHVQVLVAQLNENDLPKYLELATQLRLAGINTEVQLETKKLSKQLQYADRANIRFVVILGSDEIAKGMASIKDLRRAEQFEVAREELIKTLRVEIEQSEVMALQVKA